MNIDLVDMYGERAFANNKGDSYANSYLADKQCYELHKVLINSGIYLLIYWKNFTLKKKFRYNEKIKKF